MVDILHNVKKLSFLPPRCGSDNLPKEALSGLEETSFLSQSMYPLCGTFAFARGTVGLGCKVEWLITSVQL